MLICVYIIVSHEPHCSLSPPPSPPRLQIPTPRNAMDGALPAFKNGGVAGVPGSLACTCQNGKDCPMGKARHISGAGQPCT